MAGIVENDPDGLRKGNQLLGSAHEGARGSGSRVHSALSGLLPALGNDGYAQKFLEDNKGRQFAENIDTAARVELPTAMGGLHETVRTGIEAFEAAEDSSAREFM
ncbi:hypothetical protein [Nocardia jinanensis]|uniref:Uncharacterized protein n=1 Tax=Nocardia jinanensis TaxID=382504 RepID=A0A917VMD0_9NOCA|nr:hypothetical protein [Nocardia jinanensis]GGK98599.1 hypothetical protein GCM10011588_11460 [Nocardia jinanensis]